MRLDNSSSRLGSTLGSSRGSLTSSVQANLLKMAGQVDNGRKKEGRDRDTSRNRDRLAFVFFLCENYVQMQRFILKHWLDKNSMF